MTEQGRAEIVLRAEGLEKRYQRRLPPALDGFGVTVRRGEIYGLLGPNGAGKTTAISMLSTLIRPTTGRVALAGIDAIKNPKGARKHLGLVPQDIALYPDLTAAQNLRFFGRLYGLANPRLEERIAECLAFVGLEAKAGHRVGTFSGGMKRRVNLAAGILHQPLILFLDEPTVGIDAQSRQLIMENLLFLKENGTTMMYTTHYMEEAERLCSVVAVMDHGRKLAEGTPAALKRTHGCTDLQELFFALTGKNLRD